MTLSWSTRLASEQPVKKFCLKKTNDFENFQPEAVHFSSGRLAARLQSQFLRFGHGTGAGPGGPTLAGLVL